MNVWAMDKASKSLDLLIESNNERLTCGLITDEEAQQLSKAYGEISKILSKAASRHVKESWRENYVNA